jgi:hypothetical protein
MLVDRLRMLVGEAMLVTLSLTATSSVEPSKEVVTLSLSKGDGLGREPSCLVDRILRQAQDACRQAQDACWGSDASHPELVEGFVVSSAERVTAWEESHFAL